MSEENRTYVERRRGPDLLVRFVRWSGIIGWTIIISIVTIVGQAKPPMETYFDRVFKIKLRASWDEALLRYAFYLMIALMALCTFAFIFNLKRRRRKSDRFNKSVIFLWFASAVGMIIYLFTA